VMGQGGGKAFQDCQNNVLRSVSNDEIDDDTSNAVMLNVYDLSEDWLSANDIFSETMELGGAFHAGVEIYGREWSFGYDGICCTWPRCHDVHVYRTSILVGYTKYSADEVVCILEDEMSRRWLGDGYDLLARNCCSFARSLCRRITGECIPDWVDRLARTANVLTKPAMDAVDIATDVVMWCGPGRGVSVETDDLISEACSVLSTPAPTPKAGFDFDPFPMRSTISI